MAEEKVQEPVTEPEELSQTPKPTELERPNFHKFSPALPKHTPGQVHTLPNTNIKIFLKELFMFMCLGILPACISVWGCQVL